MPLDALADRSDRLPLPHYARMFWLLCAHQYTAVSVRAVSVRQNGVWL